MDAHSSTLPSRDLPALLDETFLVYIRGFRRFAGLVLVVAGPVGLLTVSLFQFTGGGMFPFAAAVVLRSLGSVLIFSGGAIAVGQQYVMGNIDIEACLTRPWHRVVSLLLSTAALAAIVALPLLLAVVLLGPVVSTLGDAIGDVSSVVLVTALALLALFIGVTFWCITLNAVVVEGNHALGALKRTIGLVRKRWWSVAASSVLLGLAALGLGILVTVPFAAVMLAAGSGSATAVVVQSVGGIVVGILVPPVLFIGGTLLYYDLRVRQEDYDLGALSKEIGVAVV